MHPDPEEPPGSVSNQMPEEAEGEHTQGGGGRRRSASGDEASSDEPGAAREGSQSTGHPENAG